MFERFLAAHPVDGPSFHVGHALDVREWLDIAGGRSFSGGLYRVHTHESADEFDALVSTAYPEFAGRFGCFAYDWMGRQFACKKDHAGISAGTIMFEPGTGQALEIPVDFSEFHDAELVDYADAALAHSFYREWLSAGGGAPTNRQCIGYRVPLFLGGRDTVDNLEMADLEVYWTLFGQLRKARAFPDGTVIRSVEEEA